MRKIILISVLILAAFLRMWQLDKVPVSLFGDELDVGFHAYSILKTGKDYSGNLMPMHLRSLAEWRTPLYIYSAVPTVGMFGISPLGVRLPAAIFGILGIWVIYLLAKETTNNEVIALLSALFLAISPWHLQYSRAGFEVTELLFLYTAGIYFLLRGFSAGKWFPLAVLCLGITPWVYSTAKLFLPLTIVAVLIIWRKELKKISRKYLLASIIILVIVMGPFAFNTLFSGGTERIQGISIFNDPIIEGEIGFDRLNDVRVRSESDQSVTFIDKLFHNKITAYFKIFTNNYLQSFSTQFLFIKGDSLNPRHSSGIEFYKIDFVFLVVGLIFLMTSSLDKKIKIFLIFWLLASPIPSALTQGGGSHATRLILMLPNLAMIIAFGAYYSYVKINRNFKGFFALLFSISLFLNFIFYQHDYWIHYPWRSERWWHGGFKEAISSVVNESDKYQKVIISQADEPALIFFLAYSSFPPDRFQKEYPLASENVEGFGSISRLDKYYFPPIGKGVSLYDLGSILPPKTLYLATFKEINLDLIKEPQRIPNDVKLIKSITYPSGEPAFYLFTGMALRKNNEKFP